MGHLEAIYYIHGYLKAHDYSTMVFDSEYVNWDDNNFLCKDWSDFFRDTIKEYPSNAPSPRGMPVQINVIVNASHAWNKLTRHSHSGILIYLNKSLIIWYSKAQRTVETSSFYVAKKV
jgi:hypothetical protein